MLTQFSYYYYMNLLLFNTKVRRSCASQKFFLTFNTKQAQWQKWIYTKY